MQFDALALGERAALRTIVARASHIAAKARRRFARTLLPSLAMWLIGFLSQPLLLTFATDYCMEIS